MSFSGITSVAFVGCTPGAASGDYLFVSDAQGGWRVKLMLTTPVARLVSGLSAGRTYLSRATTGSSILVVAAGQGHPDVLAFGGCAATPTAGTWAHTTDTELTRQIKPRGLAVRPDGAFACSRARSPATRCAWPEHP